MEGPKVQIQEPRKADQFHTKKRLLIKISKRDDLTVDQLRMLLHKREEHQITKIFPNGEFYENIFVRACNNNRLDIVEFMLKNDFIRNIPRFSKIHHLLM